MGLKWIVQELLSCFTEIDFSVLLKKYTKMKRKFWKCNYCIIQTASKMCHTLADNIDTFC